MKSVKASHPSMAVFDVAVIKEKKKRIIKPGMVV